MMCGYVNMHMDGGGLAQVAVRMSVLGGGGGGRGVAACLASLAAATRSGKHRSDSHRQMQSWQFMGVHTATNMRRCLALGHHQQPEILKKPAAGQSQLVVLELHSLTSSRPEEELHAGAPFMRP